MSLEVVEYKYLVRRKQVPREEVATRNSLQKNLEAVAKNLQAHESKKTEVLETNARDLNRTRVEEGS